MEPVLYGTNANPLYQNAAFAGSMRRSRLMVNYRNQWVDEPGAQAQTDWGEYPRVDLGDGPEPLSSFTMALSHSRYPAMVWSRRKNLVSWLHCHNESFRRLGGVPAVNRIDNVRTAIASGAGPFR